MSPICAILFFAIVASTVAHDDDSSRKRLPPTSSCGRFGKDSDCASPPPCTPKCSTRSQPAKKCLYDICVKGCKCNPGYIIEDLSGLCVKPKKCKKDQFYEKPRCLAYCT